MYGHHQITKKQSKTTTTKNKTKQKQQNKTKNKQKNNTKNHFVWLCKLFFTIV